AAEPAPAPAAEASAAPAGPAANGQGGGHQDGGYQGHGGGGGGRGEWQDRNFWKRNKRKRGRHGGGWQGGGGHGGPSHPPQPPPPHSGPVFGDLPDAARFADTAALDALAKEIASAKGKAVQVDELYALPLAELTAYAREFGAEFEGAPNRRQLLRQIFAKASEAKRPIRDLGYVDLTDRGAFIVHEHVNYRLYPEDPFLPESLIRRYGLKRGHRVSVLLQAPQGEERCPAVVRIDEVMGADPEEISKVTPFEELIPYYPLKRILLEAPEVQKDVSMRAVDILTPIGYGQRGLIVAPPRTGKTVLLQNIANSVSENSPETKLILLLIDERPEEVTDFRRHTKGEVVASTFDEAPESHVHCAEMVGEKARRLVEQGQHVVILLDSITRLARAYNALASNAGKIMSGGLEATALQKPKRFFGAARNIEGAGSLTIVATALIDTGSRADEVIFEEFKGTGNMELHLDRGLVERRVFPAINIDRSGTRKEELIYHPDELQRIYGLRRAMQGLGPIESMEMLIQRLKKTKSNAEFLLALSRQ
ncbi:MAG TPA: transcription termination factor Rho, partial [Opitutaceae bacterium]|nr:transcription termination factor Rho [Opitutaceae bacterium]